MLDSNFINPTLISFLVAIALTFTLITVVLFFLSVSAFIEKAAPSKRKLLFVSLLFFSIGLCFFSYSTVAKNSEAKTIYAKELFEEQPNDHLVIQDITFKTTVVEGYCYDVQEEEECTYLEFISNKNFNHAFVPIPKDFSGEINKNLTLEYKILNVEETSFVYENFLSPNGFYSVPKIEERLEMEKVALGVKLIKE